MMQVNERVLNDNDPLVATAVGHELARQLRSLDTYGSFDGWTDAKVLDPLIMTKQRRQEIPVIGDPDEVTMARVKAYYNAISALIEKQAGLMAVPMINLTHEGFGRALVIVGKLVVVDKTLRDVHRFGFKSGEKLQADTEAMVNKAVELIGKYREVAEL
jgi:probable nitrogen fixation protein